MTQIGGFLDNYRADNRSSAFKVVFSKIVPFWLLFLFLDYYYVRDYFLYCLGIRLSVVILWLLIFKLIVRSKKKKFLNEQVAALFTILAVYGIALILSFKGPEGYAYIPGILLTLAFSKYLFRFSSSSFFLLNVLSFVPVVIYCLLHRDSQECLASLFIVCAWGLCSYLLKDEDDKFSQGLADHISQLEDRVVKSQKFEFMARSFPKHMVPLADKLLNPIYVEDAVIGFTDLVSSTRISEVLDAKSDWKLTDAFTKVTVRIAIENDIVITNHTGDGVLFIANFDGSDKWPERVRNFFDMLQSSVTQLAGQWSHQLGGIETGVKIGLHRGGAVLGNLGDHGFYTAKGLSVNIAARLCDLSQAKEICLTHDLWTQHLEKSFSGWDPQVKESVSVKGLSESLTLVKLHPPSVKTGVFCQVCQAELVLVRTNGIFDFSCPQCIRV